MKTKIFLLTLAMALSGWAWTHRTAAQESHNKMHAPPAKAAPMVTATGKDAAVNIKDLLFGPKALKVKVGTKVTWTNQEAVPHTVDADDGGFSSGNLTQGQSFSFTFSKPGTYRYYCAYHGGKGGEGMSGVVKVTKK